MARTKILVVDDDETIRKSISDLLMKSGYEVLEAFDGESAIRVFFEEKEISLILLDIMMPKTDGYEVLRRIRVHSDVPVIVITALSNEDDELKSFEMGADDHITKPFSTHILLARIKALLKRAGIPGGGDELCAGPIRIDDVAHQVYVDEKPVDLSYKEYELLCFFIKNIGIALSRERILDSVWDYEFDGEDRTIDTHVKKLRSKLGKEAGDMIKTVWGMGYKMEEQ